MRCQNCRLSGKPAVIIFIRAEGIRGKIQIMSEEKRRTSSGNFVILDIQTEYAECLFRILTEQFAGEYQFYLFHDAGKMLDFVKESQAEVLLAGEEYEKSVYDFLPVQNIFVLTESPDKKKEGRTAFIYRYQSADHIVDSIRSETASPALRTEHKKQYVKKEKGSEETSLRGLIGVYSPIHRIGKTRFALRMGEKIAEQVPALYLNLEGYSGGSHYFDYSGGQDLGDLIYCLRQERTDYGLKISTMAGQSKGLDYIMPMKNELDLRSVKAQEWLELFDSILEKCVYEAVILDLGDGISGLYDILQKCDRVYTPYIRDSTAMAKLEQYEENLRITGNEEILRHTVRRQMQKRRKAERKGG